MRTLTSLTCAAVIALAMVPGVRADEHDRLTYMTFSGPVQVPGVTLAAGTYTFKLADIETNRHVVQIFNKDDNKLITTVMTIPNDRLDPANDTFVMFAERPAGTPVAVKAWFYPGRSIGEEFLYPRQQAMQIAGTSREAVLTTDGDSVSSTSTARRIDDRGTVTDVTETSTTTTSTTAASTTTAPKAPTTTVAERVTTTAPREVEQPVAVGTAGQAPAPTPAPRRLPRTASPIALVELLSGLSLAGGFAVHQLRKR